MSEDKRLQPVRVAVTGAAGQISYSLLFRIASGSMLGHDQPVSLQLLEIPSAMDALAGVAMELNDCAFELLTGVALTDDPAEAFADAEIAILVGARPRSKGMERSDLLEANGSIFTQQGRSLDTHASPDVRVLVVGNPANTNCLIAMNNAPGIPDERFTAMTRTRPQQGESAVGCSLGSLRQRCCPDGCVGEPLDHSVSRSVPLRCRWAQCDGIAERSGLDRRHLHPNSAEAWCCDH